MQWLYPVGAWALLAPLAVLALYMLKRRHERTEVPSTHLWQLTVRAQQVEHPFERLKRSLLMMLQLLLALLLAFSLMQPALWGASDASELLLVFDVSASMQAESGGATRLDLAKREAARMLDALPSGSRVSVLCAGSEVKQVASRLSGKQQILRTLEQVQPENGGAALTEALSLARAIQRELPELQIAVFSDAYQAEPQPGIRWIPAGTPEDNRAVTSLHASAGRALARVVNHGAAATVTLECTADGALCDVRSVDLADSEHASVSFDLPDGASIVRVLITTPDALVADNERACALEQAAPVKVVLAGQPNIFLEKALLLSGAQLIKTTTAEAASLGDAELYVFDSELPDPLPERGSLLLANPPSGAAGFTLGEALTGGAILPSLAEDARSLTEGLQLTGAQLRAFRPVEGGVAVLHCQGQPIMSYLVSGGRRALALGFDLHDSNLPVKYDFPVLMHNALALLLPDALQGVPDAVCGQRMTLMLSARCEEAQVILPSGASIKVAPPFPALPLHETNEVGLYRLHQTLDDGSERTQHFSVSIPQDESDLRRISAPIDAGGGGGAARYGRDLTAWLLIALLGILLVEWWVSRRED